MTNTDTSPYVTSDTTSAAEVPSADGEANTYDLRSVEDIIRLYSGLSRFDGEMLLTELCEAVRSIKDYSDKTGKPMVAQVLRWTHDNKRQITMNLPPLSPNTTESEDTQTT